MYTLEAPYPSIETTSFLPNADFNDSIGHKQSMTLKRSMDGTKRTYVKSSDRKLLTLTFELTRMKYLELLAFVESYYASKIRLTNHRGQRFVGYIVNNPFEGQVRGRAADVAGGEVTNVTLQFEGTQLNA